MTNEQIIALIRREVVPAIGCTEPVAVALCTAHAVEALGHRPERIDVRLSANILKNAMGVGIPGTGMSGLPIAVALGALIGKSEYGLEVLKEVNPTAVAEAKAWLAGHPLSIDLTKESEELLYIDVRCVAGGKESRAWSEERLKANLTKIRSFVESRNADLTIIQEVDIGSTRSYKLDERT